MALLYGIDIAICAHLALAALVYALQAFCFLKRRFSTRYANPSSSRRLGEGGLLPISLITVLEDDEDIAQAHLEALMSLDYPSYEVIAVCDGSTDRTVETIVDLFGLEQMSYPVRVRLKASKIDAIYMNPDYPGFTLVRKAKGGQADSFNCGMNISRYSLVAQTDSRFLLDKLCLRKAAAAMAEDSSIVSVFSANESVGFEGMRPSLFQYMSMSDYLKEVLECEIFGGSYRSRILFSCGFSVMEKETAIKAGGCRRDSRFPAFSQVMAINGYLKEIQSQKRVAVLTEPVCSFFAEHDFRSAKAIASFRAEELLKTFKQWKQAFFSPSYKLFGLVALPYYAIFELGAYISEIIGLITIPLMAFLNVEGIDMLLVFAMPTCIMGSSLSLLACLCLSESYTQAKTPAKQIMLAITGVLSNFGYRQLMAFWHLRGVVLSALSNKKSSAHRHSSAYIPPS